MEYSEQPVEGTRKVAEYFLICGLPETPTTYDLSKVLTHAEEIIIPERSVDFTVFSQPIVDIQLICLKTRDRPPNGYEAIRYSVSGKYKADIKGRIGEEVYICFRRGRDKPAITNIAMFTENEYQDLRPDAEIIRKTFDGKTANFRNPLTHPTYLSFTRASPTSGIDQLAVIDMCIIFPGKQETCPPAFNQLLEALYTNMLGNQAFLCFRKSLIKEHTIAYEPEVLFSYRIPSSLVELESKMHESGHSDDLSAIGPPSQQASLDPEVCQVAHFCLPWGASIESWSVDQEPPQPNHFSFVLTNESCQRLYGVAFTFHEPYDVTKLDLPMCYLLGVEPDFLFPSPGAVNVENKLNPEEEAKITARQKHFIRSRIGERVVGVTKAMCILSRWSFPVTFTNFLAFLYSRCLPGVNNSTIPLERYLAYLLCEVPFPDQNYPNVLVKLCAAPILLWLPDEISASCSCEPFYYLLKQLGVDLSINLFVHMLTEQKILLTSVQHFLLTQIGEALTSMIFPLQWTVVYIPFIYMGHVQVIESPSPYLIGVDSRFFDFFRLPSGGSTAGDTSVTYVDLDTHNFKPADIPGQPTLDAKLLPKKPIKRLRTTLLELYRQIQVFCQNQPKWNTNFLLKCLVTEPNSPLADSELELLRIRTGIGIRVKQAFLHCMTSLLKDYRRYLISVRTTQRDRLFDAEAFLNKATDDRSRPFYQALFETQQWANFVRDRTYASARDEQLSYFDSLIARHYGNRPTYSEMPAVSSLSVSSVGSHQSSNDTTASEPSVLTGNCSSQHTQDEPALLRHLSQSHLNSMSTRIFGPPTWPLPNSSFQSGESTSESDLKRNLPVCSHDLVPIRWDSKLLDRLVAYGFHVQASSAQEIANLQRTFYSYPTFASVLESQMPTSSPLSCPHYSHPSSHMRSSLSAVSSPYISRTTDVGTLGLTGLVTNFPLPFGSNLVYRRSLLELQETAESHRCIFKNSDIGWCKRLVGSIYALWFMLFPAYLGHLYVHVCNLSEQDDLVADETTKIEMGTNAAELAVNSRLFEAFQLARRLVKYNLDSCDQVIWRILLVLIYQNRPSDVSLTEFIADVSWNDTSTSIVNWIYKAFDQELKEQRRLEQERTDHLANHLNGCPQKVPNTDNHNGQTLSSPYQTSTADETRPLDADDSPAVNVSSSSNLTSKSCADASRYMADSRVIPDNCNGDAANGVEDTFSSSDPTSVSYGVHKSINSWDELNSFDHLSSVHPPLVGRAPLASVDDLSDLGYSVTEQAVVRPNSDSPVDTNDSTDRNNSIGHMMASPKALRSPVEQLEPVQRAPPTSWFEQTTSQLTPMLNHTRLHQEPRSSRSNASNSHDDHSITSHSNSSTASDTSDVISEQSYNSTKRTSTVHQKGMRHIETVLSNQFKIRTESLDSSEQISDTTGVRKSRGSLDYLNDRLVSLTESGLTTKLVQSFKNLLASKPQPNTAENSPCVSRRSISAALPPLCTPGSARLPRNMRRWQLPAVDSPGSPNISGLQHVNDSTKDNTDEGISPEVTTASSSVNSCEQNFSTLLHLRDQWFHVAGNLAVGSLHQRLFPATLSSQIPGRTLQKRFGSPLSFSNSQLSTSPVHPIPRSPSTPSHNDFERSLSEEPHSRSQPSRTKIDQLNVFLTTCNACPNCRKFIHDEEIMAAWSADEEQCNIRCPFCLYGFMPQLTVRVLGEVKRANLSPTPPCSPNSPSTRRRSATPSGNVSPCSSPRSGACVSKALMEFTQFYLSPFALRKSLETVLQREGDKCFRYNSTKHSFLCRHEQLAWNLIWYIHRLGLPTHLMEGFPSWLMERQLEKQMNTAPAPVAAGHRERPVNVLDGLLHVQLSADLPVRISLRWNAYHTNRGTSNGKPLYKIWNLHLAEYRRRGLQLPDLSTDNRSPTLEERVLEISSCPIVLQMANIVSDIRRGKMTSAFHTIIQMRRNKSVSTVSSSLEKQCSDDQLTSSISEANFTPSTNCIESTLHNSFHSNCPELYCYVCSLEGSLYRELLFLALTALVPHGINLAIFDQEYHDVYSRCLSKESCPLYESDCAPNFVAAACRQMLRPLTLVP